jgi:hypothetical protein
LDSQADQQAFGELQEEHRKLLEAAMQGRGRTVGIQRTGEAEKEVGES